MFIERNGVKIELTKEELVRAYLEQDAIFHKDEALVFFEEFVGINSDFELEKATMETSYAKELKTFEEDYGFSFWDAIDPESEFYVIDKIVKAYDNNYSTDISPYDAWTRACKGVVADMARARLAQKERAVDEADKVRLSALVVEALENIQGMGVDQGSGYYTVKSFDLYGQSFNVNCEIFKEQQDGNVYYCVYYGVDFDGGEELFSDWAYTETMDLEELKTVVAMIANADYTEVVQKSVGLDALDLHDDARECLENARITTLYDIVAIGKEGLLNIPGFETDFYPEVFVALRKIGAELPETFDKVDEIISAVDSERMTTCAHVSVYTDARELGETVYVNPAHPDAAVGFREPCVCVDVVYDGYSGDFVKECVFEELDFWATSRPNALTVAKAISETYGIPINNCLEAQKPLETVLGEANERSAETGGLDGKCIDEVVKE